jgi:hypothetical protein
MAFHNKEITIKESKDLNIANFFVTYFSKNGPLKSFQLLSLLKQQHDTILEFDSTITNLPNPHETETAALSLLKNLTELGIKYCHQKSEVKDTKGLMGILNLNKTYTAYRILAYVPDHIWRDPLFQPIIPRYGARYYICNEKTDGEKRMEDLFTGRIKEEEEKDLFAFIIYDCIEFGQMGIKTTLSKDELQMRLTE